MSFLQERKASTNQNVAIISYFICEISYVIDYFVA